MWPLSDTFVQNNIIVACMGKESCEVGIIFTLQHVCQFLIVNIIV